MHSIHTAKGDDVSVIIPTYNYGHFLDECLHSAFRQKGVNLEIIVVDDGSTDDTGQRINRYRNRVKYIYQENQGLSAARNTGIRASSGRYIQFLDADDLLGPECLQQKSRFLKRHQDKYLAVGDVRLFSKLLSKKRAKIAGWRFVLRNNLDVHLCRLNIAPPHAFLTPTHIIEKTGYFDETMKGCEDYDFWLRALGRGYIPKFCHDSHVYYRVHGASMGATKVRKGGFPFDVLVQEKKHRNEYGLHFSQLLNTTTGVLAYCDGLLTTALKINKHVNPVGKARMLELAIEQLDLLIDSTPKIYADMSKSSRLYYSRIISRKEHLIHFQNKELLDKLEILAKSYKLPTILMENMKSFFSLADHEDKIIAASTARILKGSLARNE